MSQNTLRGVLDMKDGSTVRMEIELEEEQKIRTVLEYACRCNAWQRGWDDLERIMRISFLYGQKYHGPTIRHCPWCGDKLDARRMDRTRFIDVAINKVAY